MHEQLFDNPETHSKTIITTMVMEDNRRLLVYFKRSDGEQNVPLDDCFENGIPVVFVKELDYFKEMLDLFAAMCCSRNYICSDSITKWFPIKTLQYNMWNAGISIGLRASFCKLMLALFIDAFPRGRYKKPELCRILQSQDEEAKFHKREVAQNHSLTSESGQEVRQTALNFTTALLRAKTHSSDTAPATIRSLVPGLILSSVKTESDLELPFSPENAILFELKSAILTHFMVVRDEPEFNEFSYNLIKMAHEMCRFGLFDVEFTDFDGKKCIISPKHSAYDQKNMDFSRLLRALVTSLTRGSVHLDSKKSTKSMLGKEPEKKKRSVATYTSLIAQVMKDPSSLADPVIRGSVNLKNYIESVLHKPTNDGEDGNYNLEIKTEVCELFHYASDCRLDFLLKNVVEWFVQLQTTYVSEEESMSLLPPVMAVEGMATWAEAHSFRCVLVPAFDNLDDTLESHGRILADLVKAFIFTQSYKLQTLLISLIIRLFSQRRDMLTGLKELHVLTQEEDIEIYKWTKSNITSLKHYAEQSEIWLKFWTQADPSIKERDEGKLRKVTSILEHFDSMLTIKPGITQQNVVDRQDMLYHLDTHHLLVSLIRDGMFTLAELFELPASAPVDDAREKMTGLFALCHTVLRRMVENNLRNQKCMQDYLYIFSSHLSIDVAQVPLICEIYRNNWELCISIRQEVLQQFIALIIHHGRQPRFLDLFEVVQVIRGKPITENQRKVLNLFLSSEEMKRYLLYLTPEGEHEFCFAPGQPHEQALSPYEDAPFFYHAKLFRVLMLCGFGTNRVYLNEAKCQKAIPLNSVFTLLNRAEEESSVGHDAWNVLITPLLEFFFHIYLETEKLNEELIGNPKFVAFLKSHEKRLFETESFSSVPLDNFYVFVKILNHYTNSYVKSTDEALMADQEDLMALRSFATSFMENVHKFQGCDIDRETLDAALNFMTFFEVNRDLYSIFTVKAETDAGEASERNPSSLELYGDNKKKWEQFRKDLLSSKKAKSACKAELKCLVSALIDCHLLDPELNFQRLATKVITYLRSSVAESAPVPTVLDLIQVFNYMIKSDPGKLKDRQEELNKLGATRVILALMSESELDVEVYKALLHTASKMLDGGNQVIQEEFYMFFINIPSSEVLFERLHTLFVQQADLLSGENLGQEKIDSDQVRVSLRLLQLFCENHNIDLQNYLRQQVNSRNSYDLVSATIKLLSALMKRMMFETFHVMSQCFDTLTEAVQGPCVPNQDVILDGIFLEIATSLMSYDENALIPTKYTSLVTEGTGFIDAGDPRQYVTGWMIAHLKYKCLITVHSLMEGRTDPSIITRIVRAINLEILRENLIGFYVGCEREYGAGSYHQKMFGKTEDNENYELEAFSNPQDEHPEHYLVIIENAFFIYHLMRKFQDTDNPENKQIIDEELPELSVQEGNSNFMALKLIGDLGKIGLGIVKHGMKSISKVANLGHSAVLKETLDDHEKSQKLEEAYSFLQFHTGSIEIVFNDSLCKVYFPLPFFAHCLTNDMIEGFHSSVDRSTDKSKLQSLMAKAADINEEMRHEYRLQRFINTSWVMAIIARNLSAWKDLSFVLTLVLNILILASFSSYGTDRLSEYSLFYYESRGYGIGISASGTRGLFIALGLTQIVFTTFIDVFFLVKVGPLLLSRGWRSWQVDVSGGALVRKVRCRQVYYYGKKSITAVVFLLREVDVVFYLFYLLFSVLGTFVTPLFFSFHLLDVLYRYPSLQNVIKSITLPKESLLVSFLFLLIIVYFFGIVAYAYFYFDFNPGECENLFECFCAVFDKGFKSDGGIGGYLQDWTPGEINVGRLFFDNAYNILIIIIMMNIVQGLTVDTFAVLRKQHEKDKEDRENKCFICGLEKESIERATNRPFKHHTFYEHNEWKYVHFIGYLEDKEETEYTGIESYVVEKIAKKDVSWFPQQEALSIKNQESNTDTIMLKQSEELKSTLAEIETDLKELNKSLDAGMFSQAS